MPQVRTSDRKDLSFSVSPWQTKRDATQIATDQPYTEVEVPIKKRKTEDIAFPNILKAPPSAARQDKKTAAWKTKKAGGASVAISSQPEHPSVEQAFEGVSTDPEVNEDQTDCSFSIEAQGTSLIGTAVLALLPDGHISGHLLDANHNACFGIMGSQLTAQRECTRDVEWKLLHVTIINFKTNREVSFPAERTAADAATIQAPLQMHGDEQQVIEALQGHPRTGVELKFQCTTILAGESAEKCLATFNPKLCSKDAVVNKGIVEVYNLPISLMASHAFKTEDRCQITSPAGHMTQTLMIEVSANTTALP
ncbi:MAG: hypothetical protein FRX49_06539 [Trebouxia sp. A1-2]|nr:MAG: hypothetical protein FRX49_06539 [Trebouxia sp. A1-2]